MKFCGRCGDEIATKDGDNLCARCEDDDGRDAAAKKRRARARARRKERAEVLRSLGLTRVKGALGGTYWE